MEGKTPAKLKGLIGWMEVAEEKNMNFYNTPFSKTHLHIGGGQSTTSLESCYPLPVSSAVKSGQQQVM